MAIVAEYEREVESAYHYEVKRDEEKREELQEASQIQIKIEEPEIFKKIMEKKNRNTMDKKTEKRNE